MYFNEREGNLGASNLSRIVRWLTEDENKDSKLTGQLARNQTFHFRLVHYKKQKLL